MNIFSPKSKMFLYFFGYDNFIKENLATNQKLRQKNTRQSLFNPHTIRITKNLFS